MLRMCFVMVCVCGSVGYILPHARQCGRQDSEEITNSLVEQRRYEENGKQLEVNTLVYKVDIFLTDILHSQPRHHVTIILTPYPLHQHLLNPTGIYPHLSFISPNTCRPLSSVFVSHLINQRRVRVVSMFTTV